MRDRFRQWLQKARAEIEALDRGPARPSPAGGTWGSMR